MHLIHPALVHFSVAFVVVGALCEAWGLMFRREAPSRWGEKLLLIGLASLVPTIVSGYLAANTVEVPAAAQYLLDRHERNAWIVLGLLLGAQFWRAWSGGELSRPQSLLYAVLLVAVAAFAVYGAWLGGRMVYGQGIGVF